MKKYAPKQMQPNASQFYSFVQGKISEQGKESPAALAVRHLFQASQDMYRSLDFFTNQQLTTFVESGKYLTPRQEHDLIALTAIYATSIKTSEIYRIIDNDQSISEDDRTVLRMALELYDNVAKASSIAAGNPQWVE